VPLEADGGIPCQPNAAAKLFVAIDIVPDDVTLNSGLGDIQCHWKWHHTIDRI